MKKHPPEEIEIETETKRNTDDIPKHKFWCSVRMTFVSCAFLAMTLQLLMRNSLSTAVLCMTPGTKFSNVENGETTTIEQCSIQLESNTTNVISEEVRIF